MYQCVSGVVLVCQKDRHAIVAPNYVTGITNPEVQNMVAYSKYLKMKKGSFIVSRKKKKEKRKSTIYFTRLEKNGIYNHRPISHRAPSSKQ